MRFMQYRAFVLDWYIFILFSSDKSSQKLFMVGQRNVRHISRQLDEAIGYFRMDI